MNSMNNSLTHEYNHLLTRTQCLCMLKSLKIAEQNYFYVNFIDLLKFMGEHGRRKHLKFILKNMGKIIIITRTQALTKARWMYSRKQEPREDEILKRDAKQKIRLYIYAMRAISE